MQQEIQKSIALASENTLQVPFAQVFTLKRLKASYFQDRKSHFQAEVSNGKSEDR